jgi:hypothetical protein
VTRSVGRSSLDCMPLGRAPGRCEGGIYLPVEEPPPKPMGGASAGVSSSGPAPVSAQASERESYVSQGQIYLTEWIVGFCETILIWTFCGEVISLAKSAYDLGDFYRLLDFCLLLTFLCLSTVITRSLQTICSGTHLVASSQM